MARRGRGMGGGRGGPRMGGGRAGGFRQGVGGGRGRSGRGGGPNKGDYRPRPGYSRPRGGFGFGSFLPGFLLGSMTGGRRRYYGPGGGCGGCGNGLGCGLFVLLLFILAITLLNNSDNPNFDFNQAEPQVQVRDSTIDRDPIPEGLVNETDYYTDQVNWITNPDELTEGMEVFYDLTNIQPHLYLTDEIDGETNPEFQEIQNFTQDLYDQLFTDEAHLLLVFFEGDNYERGVSYHTAVGSEAHKIFGDEAQGILFDYLDYYYYSDFSEEDYFSTVFEKTGQDMMDVSPSIFTSDSSETQISWPRIIFGVLIVLLVIGLIIYFFNRRQKNQEAEIIEPEDDDDLHF